MMSSFWLSFPTGTFILVLKKNYSRSETKLNELFNFENEPIKSPIEQFFVKMMML